MEPLKQVAQYCAEHIEDWDVKVELALRHIGRRMPIDYEGERVMIDRDDAEVFASLGEMRGRDMMRLAMGYDETKWIEEAII